MAFVDKTAQGSPFDVVTGQVMLEETVAGNQLESSWSEKVVAKNISDKHILLFVVGLSLVGRHNRDSVSGPGDGATYILSDDRFFVSDAIKPGDTLTLRDTTPGPSQLECCINPLESPDLPKAEFRVRFVQFADGSTFGDPSEGKNDLVIRATIINGLRELLQSYTQHGEQAFVTGMQQKPSWSNTLIFGQIRTSYEEKGAAAAIARARQILAVAESHEASIRGTAPK